MYLFLKKSTENITELNVKLHYFMSNIFKACSLEDIIMIRFDWMRFFGSRRIHIYTIIYPRYTERYSLFTHALTPVEILRNRLNFSDIFLFLWNRSFPQEVYNPADVDVQYMNQIELWANWNIGILKEWKRIGRQIILVRDHQWFT